jgi:hypothetical protein
MPMRSLAFRDLRLPRLGAMLANPAKTYLAVVDSDGNAWVTPDGKMILQEQK